MNVDLLTCVKRSTQALGKSYLFKSSLAVGLVGDDPAIDGIIVGDVALYGAKKVVNAITPVSSGVGFMTIAYFLKNAIIAACMRRCVNIPDQLQAVY